MKIISLYCGGGGIDQGLKQAGLKTTLAIDYDYDSCQTMKINHGCEIINGKVSDFKASLGKCDVIVGGPPCPEFSRAKKDRSYDATEVNHFWDIIKNYCKPKYWLMENVPDVIKVCKERNFLVNCANYGTPQTRIRRFFTNLDKPFQTHSEYPSSNLFGQDIKKWVSVREALGIEGVIEDRKTTFGEGIREYSVDDPSYTLLSDCRIWISSYGHSNQNREKLTRSIDMPADTVVVANEMRLTNYEIRSQKKIRNRGKDVDVKTEKELKEKHPKIYDKHPPQQMENPSSTIRAKFAAGPNDYVSDGKVARKLNLEELKILQGFPKEYKFYGLKTSVRRQIGNAVPSQPVEALFRQLTKN